jgi:surface antigen
MIRFVTSDERGEIFSERLAKPLGIAAAALIAAFLTGCSINVPLPSLMSGEATGSIKTRPTPFAGDLDETDWRIAEPHLAEALKSSSGDEPQRWANPASGRKGAFQPIAGAFKRDGQTCRAFLARISGPGSTKTVQGVGCLMAGDAVFVEETQPWKAL